MLTVLKMTPFHTPRSGRYGSQHVIWGPLSAVLDRGRRVDEPKAASTPRILHGSEVAITKTILTEVSRAWP
jgi:hypothetical protein